MRIFVKGILFPFSLLYLLVTFIRNVLFDWKVLKETSFKTPVLSIGNLTVGGTGKTPMLEFLLTNFKDQFEISTLSRGYGRKSTGFLEVLTQSLPDDVGDEPLQIKLKHRDIHVNVCEDRVKGIQHIIFRQKPDLILLDDAFQHRYVKPLVSILLSDYNRPIYADWLMPTGRLREHPNGKKRADIIIVTKCPENLSHDNAKKIVKKIKPATYQKVFFSSISYGEPVSSSETIQSNDNEVIVVTGIANPGPFLNHLKKKYTISKHLQYPDHHNFSEDEIKNIISHAGNRIIITTEKDFTRIKPKLRALNTIPEICYIPIHFEILFGQQNEFLNILKKTFEGKTM